MASETAVGGAAQIQKILLKLFRFGDVRQNGCVPFKAKRTAGLLPVQRKHRGEKRVLVTREWDGGIDLQDATQAKIAQALNEKARSMVANERTSNREVIRICEHWLACACIDAGSKFSQVQLAPLCALNQKWAAQFDPCRLLHAKTKDHKARQDFSVQRITRALPPRPMEVLIDDVHYVDIAIAEGAEPIRAPDCVDGRGKPFPLGHASFLGQGSRSAARGRGGKPVADRALPTWGHSHRILSGQRVRVCSPFRGYGTLGDLDLSALRRGILYAGGK